MLTGRPPFGSGPAPQVVQRQMTDPLVPASTLRPTLSDAVDAVLMKALAATPKKRWASASTFATALGRALERPPAEHAPQPTITEQAVQAAESLFAPTAGIGAPIIVVPTSAGQRAITGQVRAAHLRVLSKLLQHHLGESGIAKLANESPVMANALSSTLAPLSWVDLSDLIAVLDRARDLLDGQLVPRKVGRGTMSATFARLFGADPSSLPAETVLAALPTFWDRYHAWGEVEVVVHTGGADVYLGGFSGAPDVCAIVASELERIVELTGASAVGATHTACVHMGDRQCEYRLSWMTE
jgi:hypothetical protein